MALMSLDAILQKIEEAGFKIAMQKEVTLTREQAEDFYSEHRDKEYFDPLVKQMTWLVGLVTTRQIASAQLNRSEAQSILVCRTVPRTN